MASDQERQADISDAHHEGFGAGVAWADQTPDTRDGARPADVTVAIASLRTLTTCHCEPAWTDRKLHNVLCVEEYRAEVETVAGEIKLLRQCLTEAEASHQAEMGLVVEFGDAQMIRANGLVLFADELLTDNKALTARLAEAEHERDREDGLRAFAEGWAAEHAKAEHEAKARIAELEHAITQYLDSHGTAGTGVLGARLKAGLLGGVDE